MSVAEPGRDVNYTEVTEFILLGFGRGPGLQVIAFVMFLVIYIITVLGNTILVFIITANSRLHTPMYFLLMNLSLLDLCYSSVIAPRAAVSFLADTKAISYRGCATQLFFFGLFVSTEAFILTAMAYDRYIAICNPLLYPTTMSKPVCIQLVVGSYLCASVNATVQTSFTFTLHFCGSNEIDHFFCDIPPLLTLSCTVTYINQMVMFALSGIIIVSTALIILVSYVFIISAVLQTRCATGRHKTFSTCTSHIVAVSLFYGTVFFMYAQPSSLSFPDQSKVVSVFYTLVIPMLNPFIYSLRNKDVKEALRRTIGCIMLCLSSRLNNNSAKTSSMHWDNQSLETKFILVGFPGIYELQLLLFLVFLLAYALTVIENTMIIMLIWANVPLHKPMYLFLGNLSFLEIWYVSVTVPKMLLSFVTERKGISFVGCMAQLYFFLALACTECVLLAVMAYDRYVAICNPLRYSAIMSQTLCIRLVAGSWLSGFLISMWKVLFISRLTFCGVNIINHFFCDVSPLLNLACTDMSLAALVDFLLALLILLGPLSITVASYICIIATVVRIPSAKGRHKAFSTCASHLLVVTIFYASSLFIYARPRAIRSFDSNKLVSVIYTVLTPLLNPVIYCLRNKEFKDTLRKMVHGRKVFS
ncbi:uncharacterized protein ACDP82_015092 [Pangshura tecta]